MAISIHNQNKQLLLPLRQVLYDIDRTKLENQLRTLFAPDCAIHLAHPLAF